MLIVLIIKNLHSIKQSVTLTRLTSQNQNSKNQKDDITFAADRHIVEMLLSNSPFCAPFITSKIKNK